jgi:hypothetical protein
MWWFFAARDSSQFSRKKRLPDSHGENKKHPYVDGIEKHFHLVLRAHLHECLNRPFLISNLAAHTTEECRSFRCIKD